MAALLDMSTGKAGIAYVGEVPWHGLGQELEEGASLDQWRVAAGLDWKYLPRQVQYLPHFLRIRRRRLTSLALQSRGWRRILWQVITTTSGCTLFHSLLLK